MKASETMKSVWLIESGSYSDYHVSGVYLSKEDALRVAKFLGLGEDEVREWKLNPGIAELNKGLRQYRIVMRRDGTVENVDTVDDPYDLDTCLTVWDRPNAPFWKEKGIKVQSAISGTVWARNDKHAIKIANEFRAQKIASGELK
jgi:hypothetical protein